MSLWSNENLFIDLNKDDVDIKGLLSQRFNSDRMSFLLSSFILLIDHCYNKILSKNLNEFVLKFLTRRKLTLWFPHASLATADREFVQAHE